MLKNNKITYLLICLWANLDSKRKKQFLFLVCLLFFAAIAEALSIGAVLPFLSALTSPDQVFYSSYLTGIISVMGISSPSQLLLPITIFFVLISALACLMRILALWASTKLTFRIGSDLGSNIYSKVLNEPYEVYISRNSSQLIDGISVKVNSVIYGIISPLLIILSSFIMMGFILTILIIIDPVITSITFGSFGFIYFVIIILIRKKLLLNSQIISSQSINLIKILQEGLGGIRDVLMSGNQPAYCEKFNNANSLLRNAQESNLFISQIPKYPIEALGMLVIAGVAYWYTLYGGVSKLIPMLGVLAVSAQRMLPLLQQIYGAWSNIRGGQESLIEVIDLLGHAHPPLKDDIFSANIIFKHEIKLENIWFRYQVDGPWILRNINLTIKKGEQIGFIGETGSGKSTLIDIIMTLLEPTKGFVSIDGVRLSSSNKSLWRAHIAHVPQEIFLADSSILQNIAFGTPHEDINLDLVKTSAIKAKIASSIESWPGKYETLVGERGVKLSGGERQRIGIARALYKSSDVMILDEATSALDSYTETQVIKSLRSHYKSMTVLMIAHRLSTLRDCDQIIEINAGQVLKKGTYSLIANN